MTRQGAMYWVLWEAGFSASEARHIEKALDTLRLCNQGSEDLAGRLLDWKNMKIQSAVNALSNQVAMLMNSGKEITGLPDVPGLFDDDFQTAVEPSPPDRPRA